MGLRPLFNGKDLTGWTGDDRLWSVKDGAIIGSTKNATIEQNSFLSYEKSYGDFILRVKAKLDNHNSGIQFRGEQLENYAVAGYQADIAEQTYYGMLYEEKKRGFMQYWKDMSEEARAKTQEWVKPRRLGISSRSHVRAIASRLCSTVTPLATPSILTARKKASSRCNSTPARA